MTTPSGFHHLAVMTADLKGQLEFFTQTLGLPLVAIYDMHGVDGAIHAFVQLDQGACLAFCDIPGVAEVESTVGITHAGTGAGVSAPGTTQHIAFSVADRDALYGLRDRLRSNGIVAMGPIDHGMCESLYFAGPEGLTLEAAHSGERIDPRAWNDPAVAARAGIDAEDLQRFANPPEYTRPAEPLAQPDIDPTKPHLAYPEKDYAFMVSLPDETVREAASVPDPPVAVTGLAH